MEVSAAKENISGFSHILHRLNLQSGVGREYLHDSHWYVPGQEAQLWEELARIEKIKGVIASGQTAALEKLKRKFSQILDIRGTFSLLQKGDVDDVQLFEVKRFALLTGDCTALLTDLIRQCAFHPAPENFPDLNAVVEILDPRGERLPAFYVYEEYDALLRLKRKEIQALSEAVSEEEMTKKTALMEECLAIEQDIREQLATQLRAHVGALRAALRLAAYWDVLIAKAYLAADLQLVMPQAGQAAAPRQAVSCLRYKSLFHPMVKEVLTQAGHRFQVVDIDLQRAPCLLTGANMSGKTVLLKSLALAQCMLQFGFLVPAAEAQLCLFDDVALLVQDEQDETRGLSSFGAEMQRLDQALRQIKQGRKLLLLIDELARTTNPDEGKAIVSAVLERLKDTDSVSLVSTHYGNLPNEVRRLRIRGFREEKIAENADAESFDISRIQACMDYSVVEDNEQNTPPAEALRIADLLGFDAETLALAKQFYEKYNTRNKQ